MPSWSSHRSRREWELTAIFIANKPLSFSSQAGIDLPMLWAYPPSVRHYVLDDLLRVRFDPPDDRAYNKN